MQHNESIRCFVAIELPAAIKHSLAKASDSLRGRLNAPVKWVEGDALHLTLKFLGNVPASKLDEVSGAMQRACIGSAPLSLRIASLGAFPSARSPRVVWIGLEGDTEALQLLAGRVDEAMAVLGFPRETRPFAPHLTLGRVREEATSSQRDTIAAALQTAAAPECVAFDVAAVSLMRSHLSPQGARYTCLGRIALNAGKPT